MCVTEEDPDRKKMTRSVTQVLGQLFWQLFQYEILLTSMTFGTGCSPKNLGNFFIGYVEIRALAG